MKRIELKKYGFIRIPEEDFSDDGTRFTCYKLGRVLVSKAVSHGEVFIHGRIEDGDLLFDEYNALPSHKHMDDLNGCSLEGLTENDVFEFAQDCLKYSQEYTLAENAIVYPTDAEIMEKLNKERQLRISEYTEAYNAVNSNGIKLLGLSGYTVERVASYLDSLKRNTSGSIEKRFNGMNSYLKRRYMNDTNALKTSWYYKEIMDYLK